MCIHVPERISNLLSFFCLVFADGFLRSSRTVRVILAIFIQAWTTREPCRFLSSVCILIATNLKDFRMSHIIENKILKKLLKQHENPLCTLYHANNVFIGDD